MLALNYCLIIPDAFQDNDATVFQGWTPTVTDQNFIQLLKIFACLPANVKELTMSQPELLISRKFWPQKNICTIGASLVGKLELFSKNSITILGCMPENLHQIQTLVGTAENVIVISFGISEKSNFIDAKNLKGHPSQLIDDVLWACAKLHGELRGAYLSQINIPVSHGITAPNIVLLEGLGFTVSAEQTEVVLSNVTEAIDAVIGVFKTTQDVLDFKVKDAIVYLPAVKKFFYDFKSHAWNQVLRECKSKEHRQVIQSLFKGQSYSSINMPLGLSPEKLMADPIVNSIVFLRQAEIYATTAAVALLSTIETTPSIRLPNAINLFNSLYRELEEHCSRSDQKSRVKIQDVFKQINSSFVSLLGKNLLAEIGELHSATIIADVPFEWTYLGKVPMMISHEVSRIPVTPGNLVLERCATRPNMLLPRSALKNFLVIRSFEKSDPLRNLLEHAICSFPIGKDFSINYVDVTNRNELIAALNSFTGFAVIFDCHGAHGGENDVGWLQIGAEHVNTWELAYVARIPPIVILSACHTSPVAGSHASIAAGLLRSGAISVLGTFLSVDGLHSAIFVARLIYRIDAYLAALDKLGRPLVTWRELLSGFMRMSYSTDVLSFFEEKGLLTVESKLKIGFEINMRINRLDLNWIDILFASIAEISQLTILEVEQMILNEHPLMETMRYCQIGTPERIYIKLSESNE